MRKKKKKKGLFIDAVIEYIALANILIKPPLRPGVMAEYINFKTKYIKLLPEYPLNGVEVTRYRRRIKERDLQDRRHFAEDIENRLEYWQSRKRYLSSLA